MTGHDPLPVSDEQLDYCVYMALPFENTVAFLTSGVIEWQRTQIFDLKELDGEAYSNGETRFMRGRLALPQVTMETG